MTNDHTLGTTLTCLQCSISVLTHCNQYPLKWQTLKTYVKLLIAGMGATCSFEGIAYYVILFACDLSSNTDLIEYASQDILLVQNIKSYRVVMVKDSIKIISWQDFLSLMQKKSGTVEKTSSKITSSTHTLNIGHDPSNPQSFIIIISSDLNPVGRTSNLFFI